MRKIKFLIAFCIVVSLLGCKKTDINDGNKTDVTPTIKDTQFIPIVRITTDGGAGIYDKKNYVPATIKISDPEMLYSEEKEISLRMGIRGRGNSTWGWPKKPWKIKLDEAHEILGMPADKEWALLANYSDRSLLRNIVAMELSRICDFDWTPRMRSVEVYLNNSYEGVYTICEHKKVSEDRVNIGPEDFYLEIEENQDEDIVWKTSMGVPMMVQSPKKPSEEALLGIKAYIDEFEAVLKSDYASDKTKGYAAYIDVDSFIDYFIVQELCKNIDGNLRKSTFLTKTRDGKLCMYHLWDFDLTLGNCGYFDYRVGNGPEGFWIKDYKSDCTKGENWYNLMLKDKAFSSRLKARWNECYEKFCGIPDFIDDQAFKLDKAQRRNFRKWSIWESVDWVKMPSLGSYDKEVSYLKDFYTKRLDWLNEEINKL